MKTLTLKLKNLISLVVVLLLAICLVIVGQTKKEELSQIAKQKYLDSNNQTRITWGDLTGNGYDASAYNAAWNDASTGMVFNGANSYAAIKEVNLENFTLEIAFRASNLDKAGEQTLIANYQNGGYGLSIQNKKLIGKAYIDGEWKEAFVEDDDETESDILEENIMYVAHLSFDGTNLVLSLDGEEIASKQGAELKFPESNTIMMIGADPEGNTVSSNYFEGTIYEAKIYSKVLSEEEIENNLEIVERVYADGVSGRLNNIEGYIQDGLMMDLEGRKIERTQERIADLSLRTFITKINGEELSTSREPNVEIIDGKFEYKHSKNKINVVKGDTLTYKIRVYNEGKEVANAEKVGIYLPEEMNLVGLDDENSLNRQNLWTQDEGNVFITKYLSNQEIKRNGVKIIENRSIPAYSESQGLQYRDIELEVQVKEDITIDDGHRLVVVAEIMKESQNDSDSTPRNFNMTPAEIKAYKQEEAEQSTPESYIEGKEDDDDFENIYVNKTYDTKIELNKISIANDKNIGGGKVRILNNIVDSDIKLKVFNKGTVEELVKDNDGYVVPTEEGVLIGLSRLQKNVENEILVEEESAPEGYSKVIDSIVLQVKINANEEIEAKIISVVEKKVKADGTVETQELTGSIEKDAVLRDEDENGKVTKDGIATGQRVEYKIGEDGEWTRYTGTFKLPTNKTIYARSTDGTNYSGTTIKVVDNIDKIAPVIDTIADKEETLDIETSIEFHVTDTGDENYGASGISKFGISENDVDEPEEWLDADKTTDFTGTVEHIEDEGTFRIWVKDVAGNIAISNEFRIDLPDIPVVRITGITDSNGDEIGTLVNTEYYTLEECLAAIPNGATANVQVIHRIYNENNVIDGDKKVTLDLNGYTVGNRSRREPTFTIGSDDSVGSLTVINNKGRGGIQSNNTEAVVINNNSAFTLGEDNKRVVQSQPKVTGKTTGIDVRNGGIFNFYDGNITAEKAIYGNVNSTPVGYNAFIEDSTTDELQTATLQVISNVEARIGRKMYTLLEDAIADCQTKYGTDGSQVEVVLLKNIAKDQTITIEQNQNIKLDLNGHDFTTVTNGYVVENKGQFELFDSSVMTGSYDYKVEAEDTSRVSRNGGSNINTSGFVGVQRYNELAFDFDIEEYGTYMLSTSGIYMSREADIYLDDSETSMYNFAERTYGAEYTTVNVILDNLDPGTHRIRIVNNAEGGEQPIIDYFEVSNNKGSGRIYSTTNHVIHNCNFDERVTDISKIDTVDYDELINSEEVSLHKSYNVSRTWQQGNTIYRDQDNSIAIDDPLCEDWAAGYIEIDLTDKEVKPYLIQINYHAKSTGNRRLDMYFTSHQYGYVDFNNRIYLNDGNNRDDTNTYKAYVSGGSKYYIHMGMYKNRYCSNEYDFRVNSIRLIDVEDYNMAHLTITSGIIDIQKAGTGSVRLAGVFNEGNLLVKGGRFTTAVQTVDNGYKAGIMNYGLVNIQDGQFDGIICGIMNGWVSHDKYNVMPAVININNVNMNVYFTNLVEVGHSAIEIKKGTFNARRDYELYMAYEDCNVIINPEKDEDVQFVSGGSWEMYFDGDYAKQLYIYGGTFRHDGGIIYTNSTLYNQIEINGGDFNSTSGEMIYCCEATVVVNGGKFVSGGDRIFRINQHEDLTINDGQFYCTRGNSNVMYNDYNDYSWSHMIINGGYFTNTTDANDNNSWTLFQNYYGGTVTVNAGTIVAGNTVFYENRGNLKLYVKGGSITSNHGPLTSSERHDGSCLVEIGTKDGNAELEPEIKCDLNQALIISNAVTFNFYDGTLYANRERFISCDIAEIEDGCDVISENYGDNGLKVWLDNNSNKELVEIYECPDNQSLVGTKYASIQAALDECSTTAGDNVTKIRLLDNYNNFEVNTIKKGQNVIVDQNSYNLYNYKGGAFTNYGKFEMINTQRDVYHSETEKLDLLEGNTYTTSGHYFYQLNKVQDKSGRNNDLELIHTQKDPESNGIQFAYDSVGLFRSYNITNAEQKSIEIVLKTTTPENNCIYISPSGRHMAFGTWDGYFLLSCGGSNKKYPIPEDYYDGTIKDIVINYDHETNTYSIYYNGELMTNPDRWENWYGLANAYAAFLGRRENQDPFHGTIFALRQYSENLTQEQINANIVSNTEKYINNENVDNYTKDNIILDIDSQTIDWDDVSLINWNFNYHDTNAWGYQKVDLTGKSGRYTIKVNVESNISNINGYTSWGHVRVNTDTSVRSHDDGNGRFVHVTGQTTAQDYTYEVEGGKIYYVHYGLAHAWRDSGLETFTINNIEVSTISKGKIYNRNCNLITNGRRVEEGIWKDLSGNKNNGTYVGPVWDEDNRGLIFDGNDYVRIAQLNYPQMTFEATFEISSIHSGWNTIMSTYHNGGFGLSVNGSDRKLYARLYINGDYRNIPTEEEIEEDTKYTAGLMYDGEKEYLYVNGRVIDTWKNTDFDTYRYWSDNSSYLVLGGDSNSNYVSGEWLNGKIYSVRGYNRALTGLEIVQNYQKDRELYYGNDTEYIENITGYVENGRILDLEGRHHEDKIDNTPYVKLGRGLYIADDGLKSRDVIDNVGVLDVDTYKFTVDGHYVRTIRNDNDAIVNFYGVDYDSLACYDTYVFDNHKRSKINYYGGDVELTTSESSMVFNSVEDTVIDIYGGVIRKNGRYAMNQNGGNSVINIHDGTITCEGRWDGDTRIIYNYGNAKLNIENGIINYYATSSYSHRYGIDNIESAELNITGGKINWEGNYANNCYIIHNSSSTPCTIMNYEIFGKELNSTTEIIYLLNDGGSSKVTLKNSKFWQDGHSGNWYNPSAIHNYGTVDAENFIAEDIYWGIENFSNGVVNCKNCEFIDTSVGIRIDNGRVNCDNVKIENASTGINKSGSSILDFKDSTVTATNGMYSSGGTATIYGDSSIIATNDGVSNTGGTLILGIEGANSEEAGVPIVDTDKPFIEGINYGVNNTGTFKFYDGRIKANNDKSITGNITAKETGYQVKVIKYSEGEGENAVAKEDSILAQIPIIEIENVGQYTTLNDFQEAIDDLAIKDANEEPINYRINLLQNISIDAADAGLIFKEGLTGTFDIKGYRFTSANTNTITNNGNMTFIDSVGSGEYYNNSNGTYFLNNGNMKIKNVRVQTLGGGTSSEWKQTILNNGKLETENINYTNSGGNYTHMIISLGTASYKDTGSTITGDSSIGESNRPRITHRATGDCEFNNDTLTYLAYILNEDNGDMTFNNVRYTGGYQVINYKEADLIFNGTTYIETTYGVELNTDATGRVILNDETVISGYYNALMNYSTGSMIMNGGRINTRYSYSPETIRQTGNGLIQINGGTVENHVKRIFAGKMVVDGENAEINGEYIYLNTTSGMYGTFELLNGNVNCRIQCESDNVTINILGGNVNLAATSWSIDATSRYTNINIGTKDGNVTNSPHITGYIWSYYYSNTNYYDGTITVANVSDYLDPEMGFYGLVNEFEDGYMPVKNVNSEHSDWYDVTLVEQKEIAEVDGTKYDDIQDAIDACTTSGKTIKLLKDFVTTKTYTIPSGIEEGEENQELNKITFDLNGHFLSPIGRKVEDTEHTELSRVLFKNYADLTFIDSVEAEEDENGDRLTKNKKGKIHGFVQTYIDNYGELTFDAMKIVFKSQAYTSLIRNYEEGNVYFNNFYLYDRTCSGYTNHFIVDNYSTGEIRVEQSYIDYYGLYTSYRNSEQYFVYNRSNNSEKHTKYYINNTKFVANGNSAYYFVMDDYNGQMDTEIHDSELVSFNQIKKELKIYNSSINGYMYGNNFDANILLDNVNHNRYIDCRNAWFTIEDCELGTTNNWSDSFFYGRVRSIKDTNFSSYSYAQLNGTDGAGVIENTRFYRVHTYNGSNLEFNDVTILEYLENGTSSHQNCNVTINSGKYDQIYNNVVNDVITINGGEFRYLENRANATMYLYGGTVNNTSGIGVNNIGKFTLGLDDGEVSIETPSIKGTTYGLQNTGTFNFYDGIIEGQNKAINGSVTAKPASYRVSYLQNNTVAILDYVTQVENAVTMNGVYYNTLDAAIKVAPSNTETTLYINNEIGLTDTFVIPEDKIININLQGNSITYSSTEPAIINNGSLRVYDYFVNDEGVHETTYGAVRNDRGLAIDNRGILSLGDNDGSIDTTTPSVVGLGESVRNSGTFGFYDGRTIILDNNGNETITVADGSVQTASAEEISRIRRLADNEQGNNSGKVISYLSNPEIAITPEYWTNQDVDVTMNATDRVIMNVGDREHGMDLTLKQYISKVGDTSYNRKPVVTEETEQAILRTQNGVYGRSEDEVYANVEDGEDEVTYTISVYNEGTETGYAAEIIEFIPEGLTFDETNEANIANGWTVAATDSVTGRVTAVKTNNLVNKAVLADVNSDSIIKLLTGEIETVPSVDLVLKVVATPTKEKVYYTVNGEITSAKDSSGNEYGTCFNEGNQINSDLDSTPANYPGISEDDNDGDTFYTVMQKGKVNIKYVDQKTNEEIAEQTVIEGFVGDEYNALSYGKIIENYKLMREPENPAGTFTKDTQEKVFYYARRSAGVIVNHIDVNTNRIIETETKTGVEDQAYETSSKVFEGYDLVEDRMPTNASGIMTIDAITVNYYYNRKASVRVQYLDKYLTGDNAKLCEDVIINGHETDEYTTERKTFDGYKLDETSIPANANGNMTVVDDGHGNVQTETTVIYYYIKESEGVEVLYKDTNSDKEIAEKVIKSGYEGEAYTTEAKTISLYDLDESRMPLNAEGNFTKEKQTVTYYYKHVASIRAEYIDQNTNQSIVDGDAFDGHEGDVKEVRPRDFDGYVLMPESKKDDYNVTMVVTRDENNNITSFETVVTFYYKKISAGVIEKHIDMYDDTLMEDAIVHEGNEGDSYKIDPKNFEGFDLVESIGDVSMLPENSEGTMTVEPIEVKYYYIRKTQLVVKFVDIQTNEEIPNTRETTNNHRGDSYTTTGKEIVGYKLQEDRLPQNASGTMEITENEGVINVVTTVTYYYESTDTAGVTVHYRDVKSNKDIKVNGESTTYVITGERYDPYTTEPLTIEGYTLLEDRMPQNSNGELLEEAQDVIYYYVKNATVRVEYYDTATNEKVEINGVEVEDTILNGVEDEGYVTSPKAIDGFIVDENKLPENSSGVYTVVRDDNDEPTNTEIVVKYYYKAVSQGVIVNHIDIKHDTILSTETLDGIEGDNYQTSSKTFEGFDLVESQLPSNANGKFIKSVITVNYYYIRNTQVVVSYVDIEGGKLADDVIINNHEGDEYQTENKTFENYRLLQVPSNANGTAEIKVNEDESIDVVTKVTYEYESTISAGLIVHNKDIKTNEDIVTETYTGDRYSVARISAKDIPLYDLVESEIVDGEERSLLPESEEITLVKDLQEVNYYYIRQAEVVVEYRNTLTNEEIIDADLYEGHEDDSYRVSPRDISGYVLDQTRLPANSEGTMRVIRGDDGVVITTVVTFYYNQVSSGVIEKHVDIYTDTLLEPEIIHEGNVGDRYDIDAKEFENYDLVETIGEGDDKISVLPENAHGYMTKDPIEVKYLYARKAKVIVKHIDIETGEEVSPMVTINGYVGDKYTSTCDIPEGYRLVEMPEEETVTMKVETVDGIENDTIELTYKYESKHSSGIVVHYRDVKTDKDITTEAKSGERYDEYHTAPIDIENYELVEDRLPENADGIFLEERQDIVYYYIRKAHVKVEHIDVITNEEIIDADIVNGVEGERYKVDPRNIDEYVLYPEDLEGHSYMPTNAEGVMIVTRDEEGNVTNDEIVVKYYYVSASEGVVVKYIDIIKDTLLDSYLIEGHVGDDYETVEKEFEGYDIVKVDKDGYNWYPSNTKGKLTIGLIEVDYFYVRRASVRVMYLNENNERIAKDEVIEGHEGDNYSTDSKEISGYELLKDKDGNDILPDNYQGKMKTSVVDGEVDIETLVIYRYQEEGKEKPEPKPEPENNTINNTINNTVDNTINNNTIEPDPVKIDATVRVQYIDKSSNKKLTTDTIIEGYVGDKYNVKAKEFDGYELIDVPENASGTMKINIVDEKETTETLVKLYYAKKATGRLPQTGEEIAKAVLFTVAIIANISLAIIVFKKLKSED